MLVLFVAELWSFLSMQTITNVVIDPNTDSLLRINFNITVMDMPCEFATIDVVDILGTRKDNITKNINKWQVDSNGVRRNYEGRNMEQKDLLHDVHHDIDSLVSNGTKQNLCQVFLNLLTLNIAKHILKLCNLIHLPFPIIFCRCACCHHDRRHVRKLG